MITQGPITHFEIHHINVGYGDATGIITKKYNKDKDCDDVVNRILIDAGPQDTYDSKLKLYLKKYFKLENESDPHFDLIIASHYHMDHIGGFFEGNGITFDQFIDIGHHVLGDNPSSYDKNLNKKINANYNSCFTNYIAFLSNNDISRDYDENRRDFKSICIGNIDDKPVDMHFIAGDCFIVGSGKRIVNGKGNANDLNDTSIAILIEFNGHRYLTAGDLSGKALKIKDKHNMESYLLEYIKQRYPKDYYDKKPLIHVMKANHHGSANNNREEYISELNPQAIIVTPFTKFNLPAPAFIDRLNKNILYYTNAPYRVDNSYVSIEDFNSYLVEFLSMDEIKNNIFITDSNYQELKNLLQQNIEYLENDESKSEEEIKGRIASIIEHILEPIKKNELVKDHKELKIIIDCLYSLIYEQHQIRAEEVAAKDVFFYENHSAWILRCDIDGCQFFDRRMKNEHD